MRRVTMAVLAVVMLVLAGCSGSSDGHGAKASPSPRPYLLVATLAKKTTAKQKHAIEKELRATRGARGVQYLTSEQAYAELIKLLKDDPRSIGMVRPEAVPAVYRCTVPVRADAEAAEPRLKKLKGVTSVLIQQVGTKPTAIPTPT